MAAIYHTELGVRVELLSERGSYAKVRRLHDGKEFEVARSGLTAVVPASEVENLRELYPKTARWNDSESENKRR